VSGGGSVLGGDGATWCARAAPGVPEQAGGVGRTCTDGQHDERGTTAPTGGGGGTSAGPEGPLLQLRPVAAPGAGGACLPALLRRARRGPASRGGVRAGLQSALPRRAEPCIGAGSARPSGGQGVGGRPAGRAGWNPPGQGVVPGRAAPVGSLAPGRAHVPADRFVRPDDPRPAPRTFFLARVASSLYCGGMPSTHQTYVPIYRAGSRSSPPVVCLAASTSITSVPGPSFCSVQAPGSCLSPGPLQVSSSCLVADPLHPLALCRPLHPVLSPTSCLWCCLSANSGPFGVFRLLEKLERQVGLSTFVAASSFIGGVLTAVSTPVAKVQGPIYPP